MLTTDADFIARTMANKSANVIVDQERKLIKQNWKLQRNTIILREVPSDATKEDVQGLFATKFAVTDAHSDVGDTWFVSFDSEETALEALLWARNQKIRGKDVKARMKSEHILKTTTTFVPAPNSYYPPRGQYMNPYTPVAQGQAWPGQNDKAYRSGRRAPTGQHSGKDGKKGTQNQTSGEYTATQGMDARKSGKLRNSKKVPETILPSGMHSFILVVWCINYGFLLKRLVFHS